MRACRFPLFALLLIPAFAVGLILATFASRPVAGHGIFKKTLEAKYEGLKVTCNMCHVAGEKKDKRNELGQLFFEELKENNLSSRWEAVKGAERKALEKDVMAPLFLEALKVVGEKELGAEGKYADLIPAGKIAGSKLKSGTDDEEDEEDEEDDEDDDGSRN